KDALVECLIAGLCADADLKQHEIDRLDEEIHPLPWGRSQDEMQKLIRACYDRIRAFTTPEQAVAMVKSIAATLTDQGIGEKTFAMLARVLYDGAEMTPNEQMVLKAFFLAFEIPLPRLKEIGEAVKRGH